jgi:pimeloyl-ACP methyl ester carboxylesterase
MPTRRTLLLTPAIALAAQKASPKHDARFGEIPYEAFTVRDRLHREILFFVTPQPQGSGKLPLIVSILGSGADSNFLRRGDRVLDGHRVLREVFQNRARVLIVEKPGTVFGQLATRPGLSEGSSEEFRREYTMERWSEAVSASLRAARSWPSVDAGRVLVMGHSEGGRVACRVVAMNPSIGSVASLAGGGPTRLFGFVEQARSGRLYGDLSPDPTVRVQKLLDDWKQVLRRRDSISDFFFGHTYRTMASFIEASPVQDLLHTSARIYLAQGSSDLVESPATFDVLLSELLARGRDVIGDWIPGADHGFGFPSEPQRDGQRELFERIRRWFLG